MPEIGHTDINAFVIDRINLPVQYRNEYRDRVNRLRDRLNKKIASDASLDLVKMLHSGSVAKGTALRTVNDLDVAVYVKRSAAPTDDRELLPWLTGRLRDATPQMVEEQFIPQDHCVKVSFRSGLDVDVVPVLYEGDPNDYGFLVRKRTGQRVLTSIPLHLQFIRKRKNMYGLHFKQVIRLVKWWKKIEVRRDPDFRFKSFMIELLVAHLADNGVILLRDYPIAMENVFTYIVKTELTTRITFNDYYSSSEVSTKERKPIQIIDPVNPQNNVGENYSDADRKRIVAAAHRALDALGEARFATNKADATECWRDILGTGFGG